MMNPLPALGALLLAWAISAGSGLAAEGAPSIDPEADAKLRAMSAYLAGLPALRLELDIDREVIDLAGQKLQYSSSTAISLKRPDRLRVERQGAFAESTLHFDGNILTLSVAEPAVYAQLEASGDIETAIRALRYETGLDAPAGDLFFSDPYAGLVTDLISGSDLGTAFVGGVECHHLAFRARKVDWQIWIQVGDAPLPMKYVITSKWVTGAPQFTARFSNWELAPELTEGDFALQLPEGATRLEQIPVNELGELMVNGGESND